MNPCTRCFCIALISLAIAGTPAVGQEVAPVRFTGVVEDSITGRPLAGATVTLTAAHRVAFTDSLGRFSIDLRSAMTDRVRATQLGFATASFDAVIRPGTRLRIRLRPDPVMLKEVTARARRNGTYTIEGTVLDSVTRRPVPHAVVWFRSSGGNAVTDTFGHYVFERALGGPEDVVVDVLGYERRVAYRRITEPWQRLDLALEPDPIVLQGILVLNERMKQVGVRSAGFRHYFSERDLARSGRKTVGDFFQSSQVYPPPHRRASLDHSTPAMLPCYQRVTARMRYASGDTLLDRTGILPEGGSETAVIVNGRELFGGDYTPPPVEPSDFYRALYVRDFSCGGVNIVIVFTKSGLRNALHNRRGRNMLSRDSLEALLAKVDTLR